MSQAGTLVGVATAGEAHDSEGNQFINVAVEAAAAGALRNNTQAAGSTALISSQDAAVIPAQTHTQLSQSLQQGRKTRRHL